VAADRGLRRTNRRLGETMVIGLTGSIGMGKSTVSKWFQELGVPVDDADAVVHKLYGPGGAAVAPVLALFGPEVLGDDGGVSRPALTTFVVGLANSANLKKLEAVVFPLVDAARDEFMQAARERGEPLVVLDIPLLFERGSEQLCDAVVVVSAPAATQRERVLARPGMSKEKFEAILSKQVPDDMKRTKADEVLDTSLPHEATWAAAQDFVERCRSQVAEERGRPSSLAAPSPAALAAAAVAALAAAAALRSCCGV